MEKPLWMWILFTGVIIALLIIDLGILHKKNKVMSVSESIKMSVFYVTISLLFGCWIGYSMGTESAKEYLTGFIVEKTLSLDNIFVISLIFSYFSIPTQYQHRVLFWGILGVIVLRGIMIGIGSTLVSNFSWVMYLFSFFLVGTGIKMLLVRESNFSLENNIVLHWMRKHLRITKELYGEKFLVFLPHSNGKKILYCTPLFVTLVLIETADLIFAVDSIPAIFAITTDTYIIYTSNIFAILGLRALYFALAAMIERFRHLKISLALVLIFIGSKIFISDWAGLEKFPASISLGITLVLLAFGIIFSLKEHKS